MTHLYIVGTIVLLACINVCLRSLPFLLPQQWLTSKPLVFLSRLLPAAIMTNLVLFCFQDSLVDSKKTMAFLSAAGIVVVLHIGFRNVLVSIAAGTLTYMLMVA